MSNQTYLYVKRDLFVREEIGGEDLVINSQKVLHVTAFFVCVYVEEDAWRHGTDSQKYSV
jgi:hypothetical protein